MDFNPSTWGTVGQWASAVITGSAFFATLHVIRRDAKVRRMAQARKVVYVAEETNYASLVALETHDFNDGPVPHRYRYILKNLSDEPIYRAFFYAHDGLKAGIPLDSTDVILPGDEFVYDLDIDQPPLACFRDNSDAGWVRNIKGKVRPFYGRKFIKRIAAYAE